MTTQALARETSLPKAEEIIRHLETVHDYRDPEARFTVHTKRDNGGFMTWGLHRDDLRNSLPGLLESLLEDAYFSQNAFIWRKKPTRRASLARRLNACWADLDVYKVRMTAEEATAALWPRLKYTGIPMPNLLVYSGRGLHVLWLLESVRAWAENVTFWTEIQKALCQTLSPLGADESARDVSRILRIAGTLHKTAGRIVRAEYLHDDRYTLEELAEALDVPDLRRKNRGKEKSKVKRGAFKQEARAFNETTLCFARAQDLEKLNELRGGFKKGHRERACFLLRNWLQPLLGEEEALRHAQDFNRTFSPPLSASEVRTAARPGKYYRISTQTVIEWLGITEEEQRHLSALIGREERKRRQRLKMESTRRARGVKSREDYRDACRQRREATDAAVLDAFERCPGATQWDLAEEVGVNQSTVSRSLRRMGLQTRQRGPRKREKPTPYMEYMEPLFGPLNPS